MDGNYLTDIRRYLKAQEILCQKDFLCNLLKVRRRSLFCTLLYTILNYVQLNYLQLWIICNNNNFTYKIVIINNFYHNVTKPT